MNRPFIPARILLPAQADMTRWSVIACDQFTSQPEYWTEVEQLVGDAPSTLRLMIPEAYLGKRDMETEIRKVNQTMDQYLAAGVFTQVEDAFIYVERTQPDGRVRRGLVGAVDLEAYDYSPQSVSPVRASEATVVERLPVRIHMRESAALEMPHIMILIDDETDSVLGPLTGERDGLHLVYDFDLMAGGGHIQGRRITGGRAQATLAALDQLADPAKFNAKYGVKDTPVVLCVIGDGNHSLAAAKAHWENLKKALPAEKLKNHPARYALAELVNIHDTALDFEPIHRLVLGTDVPAFLAALEKKFPEGRPLTYLAQGQTGQVQVPGAQIGALIGNLQAALEELTARYGGEIDYIHGQADLEALSAQPGNVGILLPAMEKSDLFRSVIAGGVFPKKSFSMGHARDKRYYLECREIR